jgi:hypothetical protein
MNQEVRDNLNAALPDGVDVDTWSPVLEGTTTNPTTSSAVGRQYQLGGIMFFWCRFVITTNGAGNYFVALPVASVGLTGSSSSGSGSHVGGWHARDDSTGNTMAGSLQITGDDDVLMVIAEIGAQRLVSDVQPWGVSAGDVYTLSGYYPVA